MKFLVVHPGVPQKETGACKGFTSNLSLGNKEKGCGKDSKEFLFYFFEMPCLFFLSFLSHDTFFFFFFVGSLLHITTRMGCS
jgi:hypothetical protein